jgi:hypothetical protein
LASPAPANTETCSCAVQCADVRTVACQLFRDLVSTEDLKDEDLLVDANADLLLLLASNAGTRQMLRTLLVPDRPAPGEATGRLRLDVLVQRRQSIRMGEPHVAIAPTLVAPPRIADTLPSISRDLIQRMTRGAMVMLCVDCVHQTRALTRSLAR